METEAQKNAHKKYEHNKIEQITIRVPKGNRKKIEAHAKKQKLSVNKLLNNLINKELNK